MPDDNKIAGIPLVDNWRNWKRWWSMRLTIIATLLGTVAVGYQTMPPQDAALLPGWLPSAVAWTTLFTNILTGAARVVRQTPDPEGE